MVKSAFGNIFIFLHQVLHQNAIYITWLYHVYTLKLSTLVVSWASLWHCIKHTILIKYHFTCVLLCWENGPILSLNMDFSAWFSFGTFVSIPIDCSYSFVISVKMASHFKKLTFVIHTGSIYFSERNPETSDATLIFCRHSGIICYLML